MRRWVPSLVALAAALLPQPVDSLSYVMPTDQSLLAQAEGVAVFEILQRAPPQPGDTETHYLVAWRRGLAGQATFGYEWLVLPGAVGPDHYTIVDGVPLLEPGQQWLLFHERRADGKLAPVQLTLGMFLRSASSTTEPIYVRTVDVHAHGLAKSTAPFAAPRDAAAFEAWLRQAARGDPAAADYLLDADAPALLSKYSFAMFNFPTPAPARWFEFDGGQVPVWAAAGGQAGAASDEFAALQSAINAWNGDPGSQVALRYAGTGSSSADSAINVRWNDPAGEISGSFSCSQGGVLGIGGSSATTAQTRSLGGYSWAKRLRGFVVVQDGAGCWMDRNGGSNGAELLTHEIGHVLALGHSCGDGSSGSCSTTAKDQAVMRATMHGDGRGASLGSDDRAGIAQPYPAASGGQRPPLVMRSGFESDG